MHHIVCNVLLLMTFLNGANSVVCYKHFKKFLQTSLSSHEKVTGMFLFCSSDQAVSIGCVLG